MISFFTTAKAFTGDAGKRQEAALISWRRVAPDVEIILFGDGPGYRETAAKYGLVHYPDVLTSDKGCPRVDSMFNLATKISRHGIRAYVNADIILGDDLAHALPGVPFARFLLVAERHNVDFPDSDWTLHASPHQIRDYAVSRGQRAYHTAIDLFVFRGDIWSGLPPLVVGRAGYDNFLIYDCLVRGIPVVDASSQVSVIHQNHDYAHLSQGRTEVFEGPEAQVNFESIGDRRKLFTIQDADWRMEAGRLVRNRCRGEARRYAETVKTLAAGRKSWVRGVPALAFEAWCQWCERSRFLRRGQWRPLLKFPLWLLLRLLARR